MKIIDLTLTAVVVIMLWPWILVAIAIWLICKLTAAQIAPPPKQVFEATAVKQHHQPKKQPAKQEPTKKEKVTPTTKPMHFGGAKQKLNREESEELLRELGLKQ
jgi:flagellar biosynthesis/type III secretory pathway M-ring protein FliF/YscJ